MGNTLLKWIGDYLKWTGTGSNILPRMDSTWNGLGTTTWNGLGSALPGMRPIMERVMKSTEARHLSARGSRTEPNMEDWLGNLRAM